MKRKYQSIGCQTDPVEISTPKRQRKSNRKHFTPPKAIYSSAKHHETPQRSSLFAAKATAQFLDKPIDATALHTITGIPPRSQTRILRSGEVRRLHNQEDLGPDPRGPNRVVTREITRAVGEFVRDPNVPVEDKSAPYLDLVTLAGHEIPKTLHHKPYGYREVEAQTIQQHLKRDEGIGSFVREEEKELNRAQRDQRLDWIDIQLPIRPRSENWRDCAFCDEFHFSIGPQETKRMKRPAGKKWREAPENVQYKKVTSKDMKAKDEKAEERILNMCHIYVVIGYNYKRTFEYEVSNKVGKMQEDTYIKLLKELSEDPEWRRQGLTLVQDKDSAHKSKKSLNFIKKIGMEVITLPGSSPDFSILETMARTYKSRFHKKRVASVKAGIARFKKIFEEEVDHSKIQYQYEFYTKRFHDCRGRDGQTTKY